MTAGARESGMDEEGHEAPVGRLNARDSDAFDLGNLTYFPGPNVYLDRAALVFDLAPTGGPLPLPVTDYVDAVAKVYPQLTDATFPDHAHLFAGLVSLVSRLDIGLHLDRFGVQPRGRFHRVATQALDRRTQHRAVYLSGIGWRPSAPARRSTTPAAWPSSRPCSTARPMAVLPPTRSCAPPPRAASPPPTCTTKG